MIHLGDHVEFVELLSVIVIIKLYQSLLLGRVEPWVGENCSNKFLMALVQLIEQRLER